MKKPVPDKAEIALEYPEKLYVGTFERSSRFEAHLDSTGFALILDDLQHVAHGGFSDKVFRFRRDAECGIEACLLTDRLAESGRGDAYDGERGDRCFHEPLLTRFRIDGGGCL
jgi:hypothetical protein